MGFVLRFFACGFFGETESCFSAFDKSRTFRLGGGVTGRFCCIAGGGKVKGKARSVGRFYGKFIRNGSQLMDVKCKKKDLQLCYISQ